VGEMRNAYKILLIKPERKRLREKPRHRWEDNIKIDLREIGLEGVDWIHLAQYRDEWWAFVNTVVNEWLLASQEGLCFIYLFSSLVVFLVDYIPKPC
jgi:hypothetical protein